ncbi:serine hydrolase domain-containing protein [Microbacterium sp. NPDC056234]|uniref:serine hydrolase domain-containing protein n=1 Tax=Microbacterium sp. NPDC056234 TaxID=3345757 RepID=UPI0035D675C3
MTELTRLLDDHIARGTAPGIIVADGTADGRLDITTAGDLADDAIVRIQSMTKAITAVATLRLVQNGHLNLDDPIERWLPELADRRVLRTPTSPLTDTEPANRPITVRHLLTNTSGYGMLAMPSPLKDAMIANRTEASQDAVELGAQDWLNALAELPLAFQPGNGWRYHHSFGLLGILLSRLTGGPLDEHLTTDLFEPLGMVDTSSTVPPHKADRLPAAHGRDAQGVLFEIEPRAGGFYVGPAPFDVSHAELVSTARDYAAFARMLASGGTVDGERFVDPALLALLRTDQVPEALKTPDSFFPGFWDGLGWGFGVAVVTAGEHAGRYGWSGGLGTDFFIDQDGSFRIVLTQMEMGPAVMALFDDLQQAAR